MLITRVGFCPKCSKAGSPKTGQSFIVFGANSQSYKGKLALRNGVTGFTPHIYEFNRSMDKTVYYNKICCMCGCGSYLTTEGDKKFIYLNDEKWEDCYTTLSNWNALVLFKKTNLEI